MLHLKNAGVYDDEKVLKELGADDVLERKRQLEEIEREMMEEEIKAVQRTRSDERSTNARARGSQWRTVTKWRATTTIPKEEASAFPTKTKAKETDITVMILLTR